jgi:amidase
MRPGTKSDC